MAAGKGLAAAAVIGLALRLAFGLLYWVHEPLTRDEREYLALARSLAAGRGLVYDEAILDSPVQPFGRAPGYPAFLALAGGGRAATDDVPSSVKIAQSLVGACGVLIVGLLAGQWAGARGATIAAWLAASHPLLVATASRAFSEALFWPIGLGAAWLVTAASRAGGRRAAVLATLAGVLTGLATLVRPATIIFLGLAALWWLWRRSLTRVVALALGAALVIAPWTLRASERAGRFVLVASEGGVTFWTGNHPLAVGDGDLAANPPLKIASQALRNAHPDLTEEQMEPIYYREALAWMRAHPIDWLALEARKMWYLVAPVGPSYRLHSWRYFIASAGTYLLLLPMAVAGAWRLGAARGQLPGLWLLLAAAIVTCLIFFPQERFRIPVIDPVLIICAAGLWATGREVANPA
jgi:4-amino-4-deoxy-L-arabinose transferase-like glycosyltransferase